MRPLSFVCFAAVLLASACHGAQFGTAQQGAAAYDPGALPSGALGSSIRYGREIIMHTRRMLPALVGARIDCAACHVAGGTQARGGSFAGIAARFPQWNKRARRMIALQDRIAECFLYSENGRPPGYSSKEMIAVVAYLTWLSRATPMLATPAPSQGFIVPLPAALPNVGRGAALYAQRCALCHRANGNGIGESVPPLWGMQSFNNGAGMAHLNRMTGFVYYNMPQNAPGSLSLRDAEDVAAFVLSHARPKFRGNALVVFPPQRARVF
ncbi:MAG TPA: c-type cytochrome [Candidatus Tyrphobacter sp.]